MNEKVIVVPMGDQPQNYGSFIGSLEEGKKKAEVFKEATGLEYEIWGVVWTTKKPSSGKEPKSSVKR